MNLSLKCVQFDTKIRRISYSTNTMPKGCLRLVMHSGYFYLENWKESAHLVKQSITGYVGAYAVRNIPTESLS